MSHMKVGDILLDLILDAEIAISGDAVFHPAARKEWTEYVEANDDGEFIVPVQPLLIRDGTEITLVDTGFGDIAADQDDSEKRGKTYAKIEDLGVTAADVDRVIITHAHGDHMQGNTRWENGVIYPTYPNAEYVVQRLELETVRRDSPLAWQLYFEPIAKTGKLTALQGDQKLSSTVTCILTQGHTIGHQSVIISSENENTCYLGDLALQKLNLDRPEWGADWAWSKERDRENRIRVKDWARETGSILILPHDSEHTFVSIGGESV